MHQRGDVVLVAIAVYGTVYMMIKTGFAIYHHFKWMCCIKCCSSLKDKEDSQTINKIDQFWVEQYDNWRKNDYYNKSNKGQVSMIQPRIQNTNRPRII